MPNDRKRRRGGEVWLLRKEKKRERAVLLVLQTLSRARPRGRGVSRGAVAYLSNAPFLFGGVMVRDGVAGCGGWVWV